MTIGELVAQLDNQSKDMKLVVDISSLNMTDVDGNPVNELEIDDVRFVYSGRGDKVVLEVE